MKREQKRKRGGRRAVKVEMRPRLSLRMEERRESARSILSYWDASDVPEGEGELLTKEEE